MEFYITTVKDLCDEIEQLNYNEQDIQTRADKAAKLIEKCLSSFRRKIRKEEFSTTEEEIHFFKFIKPRVNSYLIFYSILADVETGKMIMCEEEFKNLVDKKIRMFKYLLKENIEFVKYYRSGMTHLDQLYFLRGSKVALFSKQYTHQYTDPEFNTSHDLVAANILAFDLVQQHFAPKPKQQSRYGPPESKLKWTGSQLDLVELIYSLHLCGVINHGDADLKEIGKTLEGTFNIKIKDLYRAFHDISNRKKERIKFLNRLVGELERKLLELDE